MLKIFIYFFKGVLVIISLSFLLIIGNLGQTATIVTLPFSISLFRRINRYLANSWWHFIMLLFHWMIGQQVEIESDLLPEHENAIVIANHQSIVDIPVLMYFTVKHHRLGDMKWFAKDVIKYVPGVGWGLLFLDSIFLKRNWHSDKHKIHKMFSRFTDNKIPIWLVFFPEGTRITNSKQMASEEFAKRSGLVVTKNVMVPRTRGFIASVNALRNYVDAIYDITIKYSNDVPTLSSYFFSGPCKVSLIVKRHEIGILPTDSDKLEVWLKDRFIEKDKLLV